VDRTRYLLLAPVERPEAPAAALDVRTLGLGPVTLPEYLRRPELMLRRGPGEVRPSAARWAEPIDRAFPSVLAENLRRLLPGTEVRLYPWPVAQKPPAQLEAEVLRFDVDDAGQAVLELRWRLLDGSANRPADREGRYTADSAGPDPAQRVEALGAVLGQWSREAAASLGSK
jgi:uncharacterized lipoprotein YmbA